VIIGEQVNNVSKVVEQRSTQRDDAYRDASFRGLYLGHDRISIRAVTGASGHEPGCQEHER